MAVSPAVLRVPFDSCYEQGNQAYLANTGLSREAFEHSMAECDAVRRAMYFELTKILANSLTGKELLELFSGDSVVPTTLVSSGVLTHATLHDQYFRGEMGAVGQSLVRRISRQNKLPGTSFRFVDTHLNGSTSRNTFSDCPSTASVINTGFALPSKFRKAPLAQPRATFLDDYPTQHIADSRFSNAQLAEFFRVLGDVLARQTELIFMESIPYSKRAYVGELEAAANKELPELLQGTPWKLEELIARPDKNLLHGRLSKAAT